MSKLVTTKINEGSSVGFRVSLYDQNSSMIIPTSLDWWLYDSFGNEIATGVPTSVTSNSLIILGSSLTNVSSGETRPELRRTLHIKAGYNDGELGFSIQRESFQITMVNNPGL